jgi:hypothetical protein
LPGNEMKILEITKKLNGTCKRVNFMNEEYFAVDPKLIKDVSGIKVVLEGFLDEKPIVRTMSDESVWGTGFAKDDHGHLTVLKIRGVTVHFPGVANLKMDEPVVVYGKTRGEIVLAKAIETYNAIFVRGSMAGL